MTELEELTRHFASIRNAEFADLGTAHYLNAASLSPLPERARSAMEGYNRKRSRVQGMSDSDFTDPPRLARARAARLIGAQPEEIALCGNTSFGINLAAMGLPLPAGSTVLVSDREFPANVYPWMHRDGFTLEVVPTDADAHPDEERLLARLGRGDVAVVSVSSVQFTDGFAADLGRIGRACREHGAFFVVDAIQSLGQLPLNVEEAQVDVLATGAHKWLCGPLGVGFVYVRRELQARLQPSFIGWTSMRSAQDLSSLLHYEWGLLDDARRYEVATAPLQDYLGMAESLELLLGAGIERIARYVDGLTTPLRSWLAATEGVRDLSCGEIGRRSGIVTFETRDLAATYRALQAAGVGCSLREGAIRVAAHLYNTPDDIARVIEVLDGRARRGWS